MSREVDRRSHVQGQLNPQRESRFQKLAQEDSQQLQGGHRLRILKLDPMTGNPSRILSENAPEEKGNHIQRALNHVKSIKKVLGLAPGQTDEFEADPNVYRTSGKATTVHLQQKYRGIPIFQANLAVHFDPNDSLEDTSGSAVEVLREVTVAPKLRVNEAVLKAANYVATPQNDEIGKKDPFGEVMSPVSIDLEGFNPRVIATFSNKADSPTVLEAGPFGDQIKASLIWFPVGADLRLSWEVITAMPSYHQMYRTLVDAENGEILYCHQMTQYIAVRGNVYLRDGSVPREMVSFPRPLEDYGVPIPNELPENFPGSWVDGKATKGNSVFARLGNTGSSVQGKTVNGSLVFDPSDPKGDDQKVLNIFYYNCFMHDFFYLLGFTEEFGNFQKVNYTGTGISSDPVDARSHSGPVFGTANMATPIDGNSPIMNMGLVSQTQCHTAFDSSVVFHEFMHGVTNRLVGGALDDRALEAPQSGGMGEGWGDYIACTINDSVVVGAWVVNDPNGIRGFPYDEKFPDHFGKIGEERYDEVHNIGEIWCATLMQVNRNIGKQLAVRLVVDALKLSPSNPGFLDMRDSIFQALEHLKTSGSLDQAQYSSAFSGLWKAFSKFGMGPNARSNGAQLSGIEADFDVPMERPKSVA